MNLKVKAINRNGSMTNERNTVVPVDVDFEALNDAAVFFGNNYKALFGKPKYSSARRLKRLSTVSIAFQGRKIYRRYLTDTRISGIDSDIVGLTPASISELSFGKNSEVVGNEVEVKKCCPICYYWHHPFHATRISCRLGLPSLILSAVSLVVALISII